MSERVISKLAAQRQFGISPWAIDRAVEAGALTPVLIPGSKRPKYREVDLRKLVTPIPRKDDRLGMRPIRVE